MTDMDDRLALLLREDLPPARDPSFRLAVFDRIERRRLQAQVALLVSVSLLTGLVLWTFAPVVTAWFASWAQVIAVLSTAAALVWACIAIVRPGVRA